jgi:hypothetical protein
MDVIKHKIGLLMNIKENFYIYIYKEVLAFVDRFMSLYFMVTGALPAVRCIRILPMN